jgi:hypothetical protein
MAVVLEVVSEVKASLLVFGIAFFKHLCATNDVEASER